MHVYRRWGKEEGRKVLLSPFWYADLMQNGQRTRVSTKCKDKREAQVKAAEMQAEITEKGKEVVNGRKPISLAEALEFYLEDLRVRRKELKGWKRIRDKALGLTPAFQDRFHLSPDMPLHELSKVHLERLKAARVAEGNADQTIVNEMQFIRGATHYVRELGVYRIPEITKWGMPVPVQKTRYLTWDEFMLVYRHLDPDRPIKLGNSGAFYVRTGQQREQAQDVQDLFVALALTGGRWYEVASLTWDRVDFANETIRLFGTKTDRERVVAMSSQVVSMLRRRNSTRDPNNPLIFPGKDGNLRGPTCAAILRTITNVGLNRPDIVERHGKATVHSLRHTYASWLIQNGADLAEAQEALGHASLQMTRRYAHLSGKSVKKLGSILTKVAEALG